jgi:hypothetical protein
MWLEVAQRRRHPRLAFWPCMPDRATQREFGTSPFNLTELTAASAGRPSWLAVLVVPAASGRKFSMSDLEVIDRQPAATALRVSGVDQSTFEAIVDRYGQQFKGLHFWKCPRIEDFGPLETLPGLTHVSIYWNQRASKLWDLSQTPKLRGLEFEDFTRLVGLDDLRKAVALDELSFGDKVWVKEVVPSLEALRGVPSLRSLSFAVRKIEDGRIQPLAALSHLEMLECPTNLFTTEQLAWLRSRLPDNAKGRVLAPVQQLRTPLPGQGPSRDVLVMGKRKPFLNSQVDAARVQRYVDDYWKLVARFRADPSLDPSTA